MTKTLKILFFSLISFAILLLSSCAGVSSNANAPVTLSQTPRHLALLVPLNGPLAGAGKAVRDGVLAAYYNTKPSQTSPTVVRVYDTAGGKNIRVLYQQAVAEGADIVIGPLQKEDVSALAKTPLTVPVLALNYPLTPAQLPNGFYEFGLSPQNEAVQAAIKIAGNGQRKVILIYPKDDWGTGVITAFAQQWQQQGGQVVDSLAYDNNTNMQAAIKSLLHANPNSACGKNGAAQNPACQSLRRQDFDSIFILATPTKAKDIVPMLQYYYAGNVPTYSISTIYGGVPNTATYNDLNGIYFCDIPWVLNNNPQLQSLQQQIANLWPSPYQSYVRLYALGLDAYVLSGQLINLSSNLSNTLDGATGTLYMDADHHIWRKVSWAQFQNGQAVAM